MLENLKSFRFTASLCVNAVHAVIFLYVKIPIFAGTNDNSL
jgi:hypothetical protein